MTLTSDAANRRLVGSGTAQNHQRLLAALARIDVPEQDRDTRLESYDLGDADPTQIVSVLSQLVPAAIASPSADGSKLYVWGDDAAHRTVAQAMEHLTESDPSSSRSLKAYPLPNGAGPTAITFMQPVAPDATLTLDANYQNLIAFATAADHQAIATAIEALRSDLVDANVKSTRVYRFQKSSPTVAYTALATLVPTATMAVDSTASVLVATATDEQHRMIDSVVTQIEADPASARIMKAYPLPRGAGPTALTIMQPVAADATLSLDATFENLIAFASETEHQAIAAAIAGLRTDLVNANGDDQIVAVYPLDPEVISASSLVTSFDDATVDQLSIQPNVETNSLIVRGSEQAQARFRGTIDSITSQLRKTNEQQTQVYRFNNAAPTVALNALTALLPQATFAIDAETSVLVATATARQHETIAKVVKQIDSERPAGNQSTRVYRLHRSSARTVNQALEMIAPKAKIGYDSGSNVVIATATEEDHKILQEAVAQIEGRAQGGIIRIYPLTNVAATVAASAVQAIADSTTAPVDVQPNEDSNSLVIVADETQHQLIRQAIEQLDAEDRQLEVFQLIVSDPFAVEMSIDDLFGDLPENATPSVSTDYETSKLFVRGTKRQIDQIRQLLVKLGESIPADSDTAVGSGNTRTIRFPGDTQTAIDQIKTIWPRLRKNRIDVITPSDQRIEPIVPGGPTSETEATESESTAPRPDTQSKRSPSPLETRLVVFQNTTRAQQPIVDKQDGQTDDNAADPPPVTITTSSDSITISSDDIDALDRMESLLRAMAGAARDSSANSNFAIFLLRNTGASDVELLLKKLFEDLPFQRGGLSTAAFVADDRLNALVVHGNRQAREMIGQLLEVLDTQELGDPLNVYRPEIVTFQYARASRVLAILENVYKTQLTAGGGRKPISIPKGVPDSVASVLQQINAATSGPVLTLDVDQPTNSLILRAPPELREEIREFTTQIDQQAKDNSSRSVRVIQLKRGKSDPIRAALEQFINAD